MLDFIGAVALLLWGLRMVKTGVSRAFGARLRHWIAVGTRNRVAAFSIGLVVTIALQSSTATALMTASFASRGLVDSVVAQALMLGANVGTGLATRILAFDIHWLAPALLTAGYVVFNFSEAKPTKAIARAVQGLGLILQSVYLFGQATEPMRDSQVIRALMASLATTPAVAVIVAAVLAVASSSSMAVVLLVMSLAAIGTVQTGLGIALVLGANLGSAVPPALASLADGPLARRVTFGNLAVRLVGCVVVLPFTNEAASLLASFDWDPTQRIVEAHILFNIALAAFMLPFLAPFSWAVCRILPDVDNGEDSPRHLDSNILDEPALALTAAARETLRIGDRVAKMLDTSLEAMRRNDAKRCASIAAMDDEVDKLNSAVKLYLARLNRTALAEKDVLRSGEIVSYAINLEHAGDIVDKNLRELIEKKIKQQLSFSDEGAAEIEQFYKVTSENLHLAQTILLSGDEQLARRLVQSKLEIRRLEERSAMNHIARLREGHVKSVQTSSLDLDVLRDLKRINAHVATVAYPILKQAGALRETRLIDAQRVEDLQASI
ncbi:phosphate:Na+ symporter [Bradyrhizobium sp. USDA 326]|uniref:Na/Pi cotransporter family protein n=1 Tax=Bradyrhizobium sp. USDA 326 TaxID=3377726 RepID=UPI003C7297A4